MIIYTKENCEKCMEIKNLAKEKGIDFEEKPLSDPDNLLEIINAGIELSTAPVIFRDGQWFTNKTTGLFRALK